MSAFTESVVEEAALAWLESVGWSVRNGAEIAPGEPAAERDDAFRKLTRPEGAELVERIRALHRLAMPELRNTANGNPAIWSTFHQVQVYKAEFESQEAWK